MEVCSTCYWSAKSFLVWTTPATGSSYNINISSHLDRPESSWRTNPQAFVPPYASGRFELSQPNRRLCWTASHIKAHQYPTSESRDWSEPIFRRLPSISMFEIYCSLKEAITTKGSCQNLQVQLPADLQRCVELSQERGTSIWLTALPIENHGFALHKSAFRDALCLRYNWPLNNQPSQRSCDHSFSIDYALSCPTGGFPWIRHNEVRHITALLLSEVCNGVSFEPHLQPLSGGTMQLHSVNTDDNSRLDIAAYGFWGSRFERASFDARVFNPCTWSNRQTSLPSTYRRHEQEKKGNTIRGSEK